jgi:hypothetical protein
LLPEDVPVALFQAHLSSDDALMTRQRDGATAILETLIGQLGDQRGPIEQVR